MIPQFPVPLVDIEIGSTPSSWSNPLASKAIAHALMDVLIIVAKSEELALCSGVHFELSLQLLCCRIGKTMLLVYPI